MLALVCAGLDAEAYQHLPLYVPLYEPGTDRTVSTAAIVDVYEGRRTCCLQIYPRHACHEYLDSVDKFGFQVDSVPQLEDISQILQVGLLCCS